MLLQLLMWMCVRTCDPSGLICGVIFQIRQAWDRDAGKQVAPPIPIDAAGPLDVHWEAAGTQFYFYAYNTPHGVNQGGLPHSNRKPRRQAANVLLLGQVYHPGLIPTQLQGNLPWQWCNG